MTNDNTNVIGLYIIQKLAHSLPVDDLMEWLIQAHPQAELKPILAMLNVIYQENFNIVPTGSGPRTYRIGEKELIAHPQRVEANVPPSC